MNFFFRLLYNCLWTSARIEALGSHPNSDKKIASDWNSRTKLYFRICNQKKTVDNKYWPMTRWSRDCRSLMLGHYLIRNCPDFGIEEGEYTTISLLVNCGSTRAKSEWGMRGERSTIILKTLHLLPLAVVLQLIRRTVVHLDLGQWHVGFYTTPLPHLTNILFVRYLGQKMPKKIMGLLFLVGGREGVLGIEKGYCWDCWGLRMGDWEVEELRG